MKTGGNAFRKTHGGHSLWEILKACAWIVSLKNAYLICSLYTSLAYIPPHTTSAAEVSIGASSEGWGMPGCFMQAN